MCVSFNSFCHKARIIFVQPRALDLLPGEDISVVTAQVEDAGNTIYPVKVEYVGKVPGLDWLTQVVIRLPDDFLNARDVLVSVSLRGKVSNKAIIGIR